MPPRLVPCGLGIDVVPVPAVGFDTGSGRWVEGAGLRFGRAELARALDSGAEMPQWAVPSELAGQLRRDYPPRHLRGATVLFTGLSGSGKSTIAGVLTALLKERGDRHVTFLDGDVVRTHLSKGLGFSRADRDTNVRRIGFVAAQVTSAGGVAICAPIAPYNATRRDVRQMVAATGGFVLVHVATSLEVCEARDRKGLYAKARQGLIPEFTGISDPYEIPADAELTLDTERTLARGGGTPGPVLSGARGLAHAGCRPGVAARPKTSSVAVGADCRPVRAGMCDVDGRMRGRGGLLGAGHTGEPTLARGRHPALTSPHSGPLAPTSALTSALMAAARCRPTRPPRGRRAVATGLHPLGLALHLRKVRRVGSITQPAVPLVALGHLQQHGPVVTDVVDAGVHVAEPGEPLRHGEHREVARARRRRPRPRSAVRRRVPRACARTL